MIYLVWAFRCMFCKHDFLHEEWISKNINRWGQSFWVSATCKLCGWHRSYKKVNT